MKTYKIEIMCISLLERSTDALTGREIGRLLARINAASIELPRPFRNGKKWVQPWIGLDGYFYQIGVWTD